MTIERSPSTSDRVTNQKPGALGVAILVYGATLGLLIANEAGVLPNMPQKPPVLTAGELKAPGYKVAP